LKKFLFKALSRRSDAEKPCDAGFLYRIDTLRSLKLVQGEGFRCDVPSRLAHMGLKSETEWASELGMRVPDKDLESKPRIYFFSSFSQAQKESVRFATHDLITRFSRNVPTLNSDHLIFPDGAMEEGTVYAIFPDFKAGDIVFPPNSIEIWARGRWQLLHKFKFSSLSYIKCNHCNIHVPKQTVKKKTYRGKFHGEKFYCEACCTPFAERT